MATGTKREFTVADVYQYNHSGPLRWILSHVGRYFYLPVLALGAAIVNNVAYSHIPLYIGQGFDQLIHPKGSHHDLVVLFLLILACVLIRGLSALACSFSYVILAHRVERNAREELYRHLLGKSQAFHNRQKVGDIMARATNDVRSLNMMFSPGLMLVMQSLLALIVPVAMIGTLHWKLLLVPGLFIVCWAFTVLDYNRRLKPTSIAQREQFGRMNARLTEAIDGIEIVKANVREQYELGRFVHDASCFRDYFVKQGYIQACYWPMLVFVISWGLALFHGLYLWHGGTLSLGQVVSFMGLVNTFRFPTFISLFSFNLIQLGMAGAARILELITTETELDQNKQGVSQKIEGRVEFRHVSFDFNGQSVLQDISFVAQPGETIAIVGQTGSGKTTLTKLINRIFEVSAGEVLIDDVDVRSWNLQSLRSQISTIEQDVFLFSRSIRENITFGRPDVTMEEIHQAAREARAHDFIMQLEQQYETVVGERGVTLSGGQKQRIAIARAFLVNPRILILDDSTSAIDSRTEDEIQQAMRRISRERTTFIITHRLSQIRWADRILVLQRGRLVDHGQHHELLRRCENYRRIFTYL